MDAEKSSPQAAGKAPSLTEQDRRIQNRAVLLYFSTFIVLFSCCPVGFLSGIGYLYRWLISEPMQLSELLWGAGEGFLICFIPVFIFFGILGYSCYQPRSSDGTNPSASDREGARPNENP
jgi:hypothetical protein